MVVALALAVVMPIALAMVQPVVQAVFSGFAIETAITPPVLLRIPSASTVPPVIVPAAIPRPEIIRMPSTPELVRPAVFTLPYALITTPLVVPEFRTKAPVVMLPLKPSANKLTPAAPVIVAPVTVRMPSLARFASVDTPRNETYPLLVSVALIMPAAKLP